MLLAMSHSTGTPSFFNRPHALQALQLLAVVFSFLGSTFPVFDLIQFGHVRVATTAWGLAAAVLAIAAAIVSRRARNGILPFVVGLALSASYLAVVRFS